MFLLKDMERIGYRMHVAESDAQFLQSLHIVWIPETLMKPMIAYKMYIVVEFIHFGNSSSK